MSKTTILGALSNLKSDSVRRAAQHTSSKWFTNKLKMVGKDRKRSLPTVGKMFLFHYSAKHKDTLEVWDANPIIIPFNMDSKSIWAINLHYAPPRMRAVVLDKLMSVAENKNMSDNTKLKVSWSILQNVVSHKLAAAMVHRYLYTHIKSSLVLIPASEWKETAMLPLAKFHGLSNQSVYRKLRR